MPSTDIPFNRLGSEAQTGGTWTQVSIPTGATGPAAPATYNDPIDFAGEPDGTYVYKYTKGTDDALVTYDWQGTTPDRSNETCALAWYIPSESPPPYTYIISDNSAYVCGDHTISDQQELPLHSTWSYGTYSGDVWYKFGTGSKNQLYQILITVDGSIYGESGIFSPAIEIFNFDTGETCVDKVSISGQAASPGSQVVTAVAVIQANTYKNVVFRISSLEGKEGQYDITIEGICP